MAYLGRWEIDDNLTFPCNTHDAATGAATDADSVPSYRVYEDETGTAILSGSMAKLDDANTTGFYSEQIALSAANGFEVGKCYTVYISATVDSVVGTMSHTFQVEAALATAAALDTVDDFLDTEIAAIKAKTDNLPASPVAVGSAMTLAAGAVDASALAADAVDEILDEVVEGSTTLRQAIRLLMSFALAKVTGGETTTITYRDIGDSKNRIVHTVDSSGNRSAVTLDGS